MSKCYRAQCDERPADGRAATTPSPGRRFAERGSGKAVWVLFATLCASFIASVFFVFLYTGRRHSQEIARDLADQPGYSGPSRLPVAAKEFPLGSPTDPNPEPPKRYGGYFPRWNLREFPEGWDENLAKTIHAYFEAMSVDPKDEEAMLRLPKTREQFREFLASLGPEALPTLAAILNAESDFVNRRFLLYAIGELGPQSERATFILRDYYMARHADPRNDSEIRHVIQAMAKLQNDTSFEVLKDFIYSPEPTVDPHRRFFVQALGEHHRREEAIPVFVDRLHAEREESDHVRNMAAQALGKVRNPQTLNELYRAAENEPYFVVKQTILGSVGKIGSPESVGFLESQYRQALAPSQGPYERENFWIRLSAARALCRIGTPEAIGTLRELQRIEPEQKGRELIDKWIAEFAQKPAD